MILDDLLGWLDGIDQSATVALNFDGGRWVDLLFFLLSSRLAWIPLALLFLYYLIFGRVEDDLRPSVQGSVHGGAGARDQRFNLKHFVVVLLGLVFTLTLCDQLSAEVIKPLVARLRPSHNDAIDQMLHYVGDYRGGRYGFVSSHAANAFGAVVYACAFVRRRRFLVFSLLFAAAVSYSRIYLGVHYLGDVVCGALLGMTIGVMMSMAVKHVFVSPGHTTTAFGPQVMARL